jgi:hypothetical protein
LIPVRVEITGLDPQIIIRLPTTSRSLVPYISLALLAST